MSQRELALRADITSAYISSVINNTRPISHAFALKLEHIFGYNAEKWMFMQERCTLDYLKFEESVNPPREEVKIMNDLKELTDFMKEQQLLPAGSEDYRLLLELRRKLRVSTLVKLPDLYRAGPYPLPPKKSANLYLLYTWCIICEILGDNSLADTPFNRQNLGKELHATKQQLLQCTTMQQMQQTLAPRGISFSLLPAFQKVSARSFIKFNPKGNLVILIRSCDKVSTNLEGYLASLLPRISSNETAGPWVFF